MTFFQSMQSPMTQVNEYVILITGSTSGIGANIALDLSAKGHKVIVTGRDQVKLDEIIAKCEGQARNQNTVRGYKADLMHIDQIDGLLKFVKETFGHLDVLINNACFRGQQKDILETTVEEFSQIFHMNVSVPAYLIHKTVKMLKNSRNHTQIVINISSTASQVVVPLQGYSISKSCLTQFNRQLSQQNGLLCLTISPGPILTEERPQHEAMSSLTLIDRVGTTQEISNIVVHCMENAKIYDGQDLVVDGGYLAREHVRCCIRKQL